MLEWNLILFFSPQFFNFARSNLGKCCLVPATQLLCMSWACASLCLSICPSVYLSVSHFRWSSLHSFQCVGRFSHCVSVFLLLTYNVGLSPSFSLSDCQYVDTFVSPSLSVAHKETQKWKRERSIVVAKCICCLWSCK